MRVAFFTNNFSPRQSGVAIASQLLKAGLERLGTKVFVFAPRYWSLFKSRPETGVMRIQSIRYPQENVAFPVPLLNSHKIKERFKKFKPDIIHIHQPFLLGRYGAKLAGQFNISAVYTYHTLNDEYTSLIPLSKVLCQYYIKTCERYCMNLSRAIIAPTVGIKHYLLKRGYTKPIWVIPSGIDLKHFSSRNIVLDQKKSIAQYLRIKPDQTMFLFVGRISPEKNIEFLLRSFIYIKKNLPSSRLLIIGSGVKRKYFQHLAGQLGLNRGVEWLGHVQHHDLIYYYDLADLFLFPSKTDTQGVVIYESLAMGVPVLALKSLASGAIIKDNINGAEVDGENPLDFAQRALSLTRFKKYMNWVLPLEFSYQATAQKVRSIYNQLKKSNE